MGGSAPSGKQVKKQADYQYGLDKRAMQDQLEANRANQQTPWGSVSWSQDPSGQWSQTTTLDPAEQQRLDQQRQLLTGLGGVSQGLIGQVGEQIKNPLDLSGMAQGPTGAPTGPQFGTVGQGPQFNTDFGSIDPNKLAGMGQAGPASSFGGAGSGTSQAREYDLQRQIDMSGLPGMPEASEAVRQQTIDALYQQAQSRMNPEQEQQRREQLDRLYAMGGREGDAFFNEQQGNLGRQQTDQRQQALWNAIGQGGVEQSRLFADALSGRQQGWQEALGRGNFANQALMNQYQQGLGNAQMANQVGMANAANANQAGIASMQGANNMAQFNAGQGMQGMLAGLGYNREGLTLGNEALQQGWQNQMAGTGFNNAVGQQGFQNQLTSQNQQQQIRDQQIQEALMQRGLGMNELSNALGMMGQVQNPQFGGYAQGQVSAPDYLNLWENNLDRRAADKQAALQGATSLAGSFMGFSDRRLKRSIERIGSIGGVNIYKWEYIWGESSVGVMADEVPHAIAGTIDGYSVVDYRRIW